jgi:hypothetical protein
VTVAARVQALKVLLVEDHHPLYLSNTAFHAWVDVTARMLVASVDLAAATTAARQQEMDDDDAEAAAMWGVDPARG